MDAHVPAQSAPVSRDVSQAYLPGPFPLSHSGHGTPTHSPVNSRPGTPTGSRPGEVDGQKHHKGPAYSLSHTRFAPQASAVEETRHRTHQGPLFGLAHALPSKEQQEKYYQEKTARKKGHTPTSTAPPSLRNSLEMSPTTSVNANQPQFLMVTTEQLKELVREETKRAEEKKAEEIARELEKKEKEEEQEKQADEPLTETAAASGGGGENAQPEADIRRSDGTSYGTDSLYVSSDKAGAHPKAEHEPAEHREVATIDPGLIERNGEVIDEFPNPWAKIRYHLREPFAEFLGTCLLIIFGTGVNCQVILSGDSQTQLYGAGAKGQYLSISFGWGIGVAMGVWVAGGISGGMINPAVTIALATFRGFPWKKVPIYILAQLLGAFTGAILTYANYKNAIDLYEGGPNIRTIEKTAALFSTYPAKFLEAPHSRISCFISEFIATAVLLIVILAIGDSNNTPPVEGMNPLALLWLIVGIGACIGWQTAYAVNPARDIGPRFMTWLVGYGSDVWTYLDWYWLWVPTLATITGGLFGAFIYDLLIYEGGESPLNKKWRFSDIRFGRGSKDKLPAGVMSKGPGVAVAASDMPLKIA